MASLDAGAIDEDLDLVAVGQDLGGEACYVWLRREVCRVNGRLAAELLDRRLGGLG